MARGRIPRACTNCRRNKTKCQVSEGNTTCDKCKVLQLECSFIKKPAGAANMPAPALVSRLGRVEAQLDSIMRVVNEQKALIGRYESMDGVMERNGHGNPSVGVNIKDSPGSASGSVSTPMIGMNHSHSHIHSRNHSHSHISTASPADSDVSGRSGASPSLPPPVSPMGPQGPQTDKDSHIRGPALVAGLSPPLTGIPHTLGHSRQQNGHHRSSSSMSMGSVHRGQAMGPSLVGVGTGPGPNQAQSHSHINSESSTPLSTNGDTVAPPQIAACNVIADLSVVDVTKNPTFHQLGYTRPGPDIAEDPQVLANPANRSGVGSLGFPYQTSLAYFVSSVVSPAYRYGQHFVGPARPTESHENIVSKGILSKEQVVELIGYFRDNYNHWVLFDHDSTDEELTDMLLERSNLLVLSCCCIAMRSGKPNLRASVFPYFVKHLASELHAASAHVPQTVDFLRSVCLIATFGDSLSCHEILFDIWAVTCMGIEHFSNLIVSDPGDSILLLRLWNHLVLAHLTACNTSGRQCLIDADGIAVTRNITHYPLASHFDLCMVAEIALHYLSYRYSTYELTFEQVQREEQQWQNDWSFLLLQPAIQFVGALHHYLDFNLHLQEAVRNAGLSPAQMVNVISLGGPASYSASASYFEALFRNHNTVTLLLMLESLNKSICALMEVVPEDFFAFLSDGLHRMGFVSSVMVLRITALLKHRELTRDAQYTIERVLGLVRQLSDRYQATSGSPGDMSNSFALSIYDLLGRYNL